MAMNPPRGGTPFSDFMGPPAPPSAPAPGSNGKLPPEMIPGLQLMRMIIDTILAEATGAGGMPQAAATPMGPPEMPMPTGPPPRPAAPPQPRREPPAGARLPSPRAPIE